MSAVVGQWRATYTPGDWVLLSGPTSVVLLEPPPPERSSLVTVLWEEVVASSSMTELADRLAAYPLASLPSFAAFFWTGSGMRSLVRGGVSVVDLDSGATVAEGEGIQTWTEVGLDGVRQVLVEAHTGEGTRLELPLVVGAVRASSVRLDATEAARVSSPQQPAAALAAGPASLHSPARAYPEQLPPDHVDAPAPPYAEDALPAYAEQQPPPAYAEDVIPAYAEQRPDAAEEDGDTADPDGPRDPTLPMAELPAPDPTPALPGPTAGPDLLDGPTTEGLADPFADEAGAGWRPDGDDRPTADPWAEEPWQEPVPARALPTEAQVAEMENASTQLMVPSYPSPSETTGEDAQHSLIMAVVCQYGHASAQNATSCRICGSSIAPQGPQLVPRPVLAVLRSSDGSAADVDRAVLIGRAPSAQRSSARGPKLMTVPSPGHDISRTHLEVAPEGWTVVVTDLHSTNGTVLIRPDGGEREPLPAGESVVVQPGSVLELGDGISVLIDFPQ